MKRLDPNNLEGAKDLIAEDAVWHYFNPNLPDLEGDYVGLVGIPTFFEKVGERFQGTFKVNPVSVTPVGDELVVVQTRNTLTREGKNIALDVVVVWRILDNRIVEIWDIVPRRPAIWHWFALNDARDPFAFAGIWRSYKGRVKKDGETVEIDTYAFLTTKPNALVATIHPTRMPVMLAQEEAQDIWLEGSAEDAQKLIGPFPADRMKIVQTGTEKMDLAA